MSDDWKADDPFSDSTDPAAAAREQRRREREEKRLEKEGRAAAEEAAAPPPPPPPPPQPPVPPRTPEEDFWDEDSAEDEARQEDEEAGAPYEEDGPYFEEEAREAPPAGGGGPRGPRRGAGALGALRRHPFRVVGALVALLALWFLAALFQPFHGDGSGRVAVTVPKGASVSEVGDILDQKGVVSSSNLFQVRVTLAGKRSDLYPGHFTLAHDMSYGDAIDALSKAPVKTVTTVTIPEGYSRRQAAPLVAEDGLTGSYVKESVHSKYLNPAKYGGKGAKNLEGFLFPDTFELKPGAPAADLVQLQLEDFRRRIKGVDMSYAKFEEPDRLRRAHDRLDGAGGVGHRGAGQARRRRDLQPPARRHAAGHRRDDPLRRRQLRKPADRIGAGHRLALQHEDQQRASAGPDQQPGPLGDRSRGAPLEGRLPLLRDQAGGLQRTRILQDRSRIRSGRRQLRKGAGRSRRQLTDQLRRMKRLAVLGHPVAHSRSPAMHNAALAELGLGEEWHYEAIDLAPEEFERRVRQLPDEGFVGANVTVPHKGAALALADSLSETAREIGAANTLSFEADGIRADNTDADGLLAALPGPPAGLRALVLGAGGAARAIVWALQRAGAEVEVWNRTGLRSRHLCEQLGGSPVDAPAQGDYGLIVNSTAVGLHGEDPFAELPLAAAEFSAGQVVVDMVYGERRSTLLAAADAAGAATVDGIAVLVRQGALSFRIWTGREASLQTMAEAAVRV